MIKNVVDFPMESPNKVTKCSGMDNQARLIKTRVVTHTKHWPTFLQ